MSTCRIEIFIQEEAEEFEVFQERINKFINENSIKKMELIPAVFSGKNGLILSYRVESV